MGQFWISRALWFFWGGSDFFTPICSAWFTESKTVCWETTKVSKVVFSSLFFSHRITVKPLPRQLELAAASCHFPAQTNTLQRVRHFFFTFGDVGSSPSLVRGIFCTFFQFLSFRCVFFFYLFIFLLHRSGSFFFVFIGNPFLFLVFIFWRIFVCKIYFHGHQSSYLVVTCVNLCLFISYCWALGDKWQEEGSNSLPVDVREAPSPSSFKRRLLNILKEPCNLSKLSNICFNNPSTVQKRIGAVLSLLSSRVFFYLAHVSHPLLLLLLLIVNYIVPFSFCLYSFLFFLIFFFFFSFLIFYSGISLSRLCLLSCLLKQMQYNRYSKTWIVPLILRKRIPKLRDRGLELHLRKEQEWGRWKLRCIIWSI